MPRYITYRQLKRLGACQEELETFRRHFGYSKVLVTEDKAEEVAESFSWGWAGYNFLSRKGYEVYSKGNAIARQELLYDLVVANDKKNKAAVKVALKNEAYKKWYITRARAFASAYINDPDPHDSIIAAVESLRSRRKK